MARPQKFRHSREALNDPQVAEKLGRFVIDIEALRQTRKQIDDQIAAAYDAVNDGGFEKKFVRKVVSLRAKETDKRRDEEEGLEAYEFAIEKGISLACARRKPNLPPHDPETGEITEPDHQSGLTDEVRTDVDLSSEAGTSVQVSSAPLEGASDKTSGIISPSTVSTRTVDETAEQAVAKPQAPHIATATFSPDPHPSTGTDGCRADEGAKSEEIAVSSSVGTAPAEQRSLQAEQAVTLSLSSEASSLPLTTTGADAPPPVSAPTNSEKPHCLKLKNGHCKISFETPALCSECNARRFAEASA